MIRILIIVLRGENVGKEQTKSPSQVSERVIKVIRLGYQIQILQPPYCQYHKCYVQ